MFALLKYLPLLMAGKDITAAYKAETGKDKPAWASGRLLGAMFATIGVGLAIAFGVKIDQDQIKLLTDNTEAMIGAGMIVYGIVRGIIGKIQAVKRGA